MRSTATLAAVLCITRAIAQTARELSICPLDSQRYPPPVGLTVEPILQAATKSLEDALDAGLGVFPYNETSFSIGLFSTTDSGLVWQYHHSTALLANSSQGARSVDADSIYRVASISKLLTVYLFLICEAEHRWNDPIVKWIPELARSEGSGAGGVPPNWDTISIGDLAGHTAGLSRDYGLLDFAVLNQSQVPPAFRELLPEAPAADIPICGYVTPGLTFIECTSEEYLRGVAGETPVFPAGYTPVYSNQAFVLIGIALERVTGVTLEELFETRLVQALDLNATSYVKPPPVTEHALVPVSPRATFWDADLGAFAPAGGAFSSTNDFASIGKAILSNKLLSQSSTRRWLKPRAFAGGLQAAVGQPWEIFRLSRTNEVVVDIYTKAGDLGYYDTVFVLIPDYNIGYTVFTAPDPTGLAGATVRNELPNLLTEKLVEAVDSIAKSQAERNFVGTFSDPVTNSSVSIAADDSPALHLVAWTNNGSDIYKDLFEQLAPSIDIRLLPNHLYDGQSDEVGFTSNYQAPMPSRLFFGPCYGWINVDQFMFAGVPMGQFVFEVETGGKAVAIRSIGFRNRMERTG